MKTILTIATLVGAMAIQPVWAGEGQGQPFAYSSPPLSTTMVRKTGGDTEYFRWTASPTASQYSQKRGGDTEYFRWSAAPIPAPTSQASHPASPAGSNG